MPHFRFALTHSAQDLRFDIDPDIMMGELCVEGPVS
jgi:hypothetical protein